VREIHLRLYILGTSARASLARQRVEEFCGQFPPGRLRLEVIDLLVDGEVAERDRIIATPSLRRVMPLPVVSLVGDMGDEQQLVALVNVDATQGRAM